MRPVAPRFERNTCPEPNSGCLLWTAAVCNNGYGKMWVDGKRRQATHVALFLATGRWPTQLVLHKCDTPSCVNVAHLWEGSNLENMRDKVAKRRDHQSKKTHCPQGHAYTADNTYVWRGTHRRCRACLRVATKVYYASKGAARRRAARAA